MDDHRKRPHRLQRESRPTYPAAAAGETWNMSWIMGDAWPMMPMPALTFMQRTIQSIQNCGVFQAEFTLTSAFVIRGFTCSFGSQPAGFHPSGGTRTINAPEIMKTE